MSELKELRRLQDEERALMNIATKLSDQLNRLKVEELALLNMIKVRDGHEEDTGTTDVNADDKMVEDDMVIDKEEVAKKGVTGPEEKTSGLVSLDLAVTKQRVDDQMEEEEEEEEDDLEMMNAFNDPL